jgi:hypothetical protein
MSRPLQLVAKMYRKGHTIKANPQAFDEPTTGLGRIHAAPGGTENQEAEEIVGWTARSLCG